MRVLLALALAIVTQQDPTPPERPDAPAAPSTDPESPQSQPPPPPPPSSAPPPPPPVAAARATDSTHSDREGFFLGFGFGGGALIAPALADRGFDSNSGMVGAVGGFRIGLGISESLLLFGDITVQTGQERPLSSRLWTAHIDAAAQLFVYEGLFLRGLVGVANTHHDQPWKKSQTSGPSFGLIAGHEWRAWHMVGISLEGGAYVAATKDYTGVNPLIQGGMVWYW